MTPAIRFSKLPSGKWYTVSVRMEYGQPVDKESAYSAILAGHTAFVTEQARDELINQLKADGLAFN